MPKYRFIHVKHVKHIHSLWASHRLWATSLLLPGHPAAGIALAERRDDLLVNQQAANEVRLGLAQNQPEAQKN